MASFKVGVQLHPQATDVSTLLDAAEEAEDMGVDTIWTWDHFFPLYGPPDAEHFECYSLLAAMSQRTNRARLGALVTCVAYRNPNLLADMARTIDHLSAGRFILGLGAGWFERDYQEYGYPFPGPAARLAAFEDALGTISERLTRLAPPAIDMPLLIGGSGRNVTLRIVAERADMWNSFGPPEKFAELNGVLDDWCERVGRDPAEVERTVCIEPDEVDRWSDYLGAGAQHIIVMTGDPFALDAVGRLVGSAAS